MSGRAVTSTLLQGIVHPRAPRSPAARLAVVASIIGVPLALHMITGGRWLGLIVTVAAVTSLLTLVPSLSWLVKPVGTYAGLWLVFNVLRASADDTAWSDGVLALVPRAEQWLTGGKLPSAWLQDRLHHASDLVWYDYGLTIVYVSFFVAPYIIAASLIWRRRHLFWHYSIATAILFAVSIASFYLMPTAPPWLVADLVSGGEFPQVRRVTEPVIASLDLPMELFSESTRGGARTSEVRLEPNPIAAMPSIHFAATAMIVGPARRAGRAALTVAAMYALLMGLALVYLGEHYVLDLVAGGVLTAIGWVVTGRWLAATGDLDPGERP